MVKSAIETGRNVSPTNPYAYAGTVRGSLEVDADALPDLNPPGKPLIKMVLVLKMVRSKSSAPYI